MSAPSIRRALRGLAGLVLIAVLATACSAGATAIPPPVATTTPTTVPATPSPLASAPPTTAPATATPGSSNGGRYGGGGGSSASPAVGAVVLSKATTSLGAVVTGPNGLTLYTHAGDTATSSSCTGGCASAWPPLTVAAGAKATAGAGVTGTIGTLTRADGTVQITYKGLPLYGWQGDSKPGDVTGQGVAGFSVAKP